MDKNKALYKERKIIVVDRCDTCPFYGKCKAWKKLNTKQRVKLAIGNGIGAFILKNCPLPYGEDNAEPFKGIDNG